MSSRTVRLMALAMAVLAAAPGASRAQDQVLPPPTAANPAPIYSAQQLDQLLAPIALYPDALLGQILIASTYPLEVVEAARWVAEPQNAALKGEALDRA